MDHDPEVEAEFARRRQEVPSIFAFHGTGADCVYSLQRNSLRNLSNSALMTAGAAYGQGIYISNQQATSDGYSRAVNTRSRTGYGTGAANYGTQSTTEMAGGMEN